MLMLYAWIIMSMIILMSPPKYLWRMSLLQASLIAVEATRWVYVGNYSTHLFSIDPAHTPVVLLMSWLLPLTLLTSQNKLHPYPVHQQRLFITSIMAVQMISFIALTTTNLLPSFISYEATLIPIVFVVAQWGTQKRRLETGLYLMFYSMVGAIPLFLWLLELLNTHSIFLFDLLQLMPHIETHYPVLCWIICNAPSLMKLPLFCLLLWPMKTHTTTPVANSVILISILLKLAGYSAMHASILITQNSINHTLIVLLLATLGLLITVMLCLRQVDFKFLIAVSSASHMSLFIIATTISTPFSYTGVILMIIAHTLTASTMLHFADSTYEQSFNHTLILFRGALLIFPLISLWWLLFSLADTALAPLTNFPAGLPAVLTLRIWSPLTFLLVVFALLLTTSRTLDIFYSTQKEPAPQHLQALPPTLFRGYALMALHLIPLLLTIFKLELLTLLGY